MKYLLIDGNYICNMVWHTKAGQLLNGVVYSALKQVLSLDRITNGKTKQIWCFDSGNLHRKALFPGYKEKRAKARNEQLKLEDSTDEFGGTPDSDQQNKSGTPLSELFTQMSRLREVLRELGIIVCKQDKYEGDDFIAAICLDVAIIKSDKIIVANDEDFWQLLKNTGDHHGSVKMYSPRTKSFYSEDNLRKDYGITPKMSAVAKAIAGCTTDEIPGVPGVGFATACKYLLGYASDKVDAKITDAGRLINFNYRLVSLPWEIWPNVPREVFDDSVGCPSLDTWNQIVTGLNMPSLILSPKGAPN